MSIYRTTVIPVFSPPESVDEKEPVVLIAEDNASMRAAIAMKLALQEQFTCIFVENGEEAVKALKGERFQQIDAKPFSYPILPSFFPAFSAGSTAGCSVSTTTATSSFLSSPESETYSLTESARSFSLCNNASSALSSVVSSPITTQQPLGFTLDELNAEVAFVLMDNQSKRQFNPY